MMDEIDGIARAHIGSLTSSGSLHRVYLMYDTVDMDIMYARYACLYQNDVGLIDMFLITVPLQEITLWTAPIRWGRPTISNDTLWTLHDFVPLHYVYLRDICVTFTCDTFLASLKDVRPHAPVTRITEVERLQADIGNLTKSAAHR